MKGLLPALFFLLGDAFAAPPLVIAHRGASGYLPEHTLEAYALAIRQGAHFIEPDLVITKDGVLVARHENEISETTDVASRPEFAARRTTKTIDGKSVSGWFSEDFTLAELKTLRATERIPGIRPANAKHDGRYAVPTFDEVVQLAKREGVGVYPETKHPGYFEAIGLPLEAALVEILGRHGYRKVYIQSFEAASLKKLARMTDLPLVQLLGEKAKFDLGEIASYARGIGPNKSLITPELVREAHARKLVVHGWTFRAENHFLPPRFRKGEDPAALGDLHGEIRHYLEMGMDGYFTDHPDK
jgi:glycerophosphoryl diester phosphodiesterase